MVSFVFLLLSSTVYALNTWSSGYKVNSGTTVDVRYGPSQLCRKVTNTSANSFFVPSKTVAEWNAFEANLPPGVSTADCCVPAWGAACGGSECINQGTWSCNGLICLGETIKPNETDCTGICKSCSGGSCVNSPDGADYQNECSPYTCSNEIRGWLGNSCSRFTSDQSDNGDCDGSGSCNSLLDSCQGTAVTATCGSAECKKSCPVGASVASYDSVSEVCYTSGQNGCNAGEVCNNSGTCVSTCSNECSPSGTTQCLTPSIRQTCGNYDADPCLEWGNNTIGVWITGAWSACNTNCGTVTQTRTVSCSTSCCDPATRPASSKSCTVTSGCRWVMTAGVECASCGGGQWSGQSCSTPGATDYEELDCFIAGDAQCGNGGYYRNVMICQ